jgi:hypothetical protein
MDPTRMRNEDLEPKEVKIRVQDLFNLKDHSFKKLTVIEPVFKLTRPPPLVSQMLSDSSPYLRKHVTLIGIIL